MIKHQHRQAERGCERRVGHPESERAEGLPDLCQCLPWPGNKAIILISPPDGEEVFKLLSKEKTEAVFSLLAVWNSGALLPFFIKHTMMYSCCLTLL